MHRIKSEPLTMIYKSLHDLTSAYLFNPISYCSPSGSLHFRHTDLIPVIWKDQTCFQQRGFTFSVPSAWTLPPAVCIVISFSSARPLLKYHFKEVFPKLCLAISSFFFPLYPLNLLYFPSYDLSVPKTIIFLI